MSEKKTPMDIFWYVVLLFWLATILVPLLWILFEATKSNQEFFGGIWNLPEKIHWKNYAQAWNDFHIGRAMLNSVYYVGVGVLLGTFLTTISAYTLTRLQWRGRAFIWGTIWLALFLPGINALIPQYVLVRSLGLTNSLTGLILLDNLGESVFFLVLLGGFMQSLPKSLEDSAFIDGASILQTFTRIIIPMSMPGIVTVGIFKFLGLYNNFIHPFIYLSDESKYPVSVEMYQANQLMEYSANYVVMFAGVIIAMIPTLIMFIFFQRFIMEGATLGAVKG